VQRAHATTPPPPHPHLHHPLCSWLRGGAARARMRRDLRAFSNRARALSGVGMREDGSRRAQCVMHADCGSAQGEWGGSSSEWAGAGIQRQSWSGAVRVGAVAHVSVCAARWLAHHAMTHAPRSPKMECSGRWDGATHRASRGRWGRGGERHSRQPPDNEGATRRVPEARRWQVCAPPTPPPPPPPPPRPPSSSPRERKAAGAHRHYTDEAVPSVRGGVGLCGGGGSCVRVHNGHCAAAARRRDTVQSTAGRRAWSRRCARRGGRAVGGAGC
jgi:hypothetical protein